MKKSIFAPLMWLSLTIILVSAFVMGCIHIILIDRYIISTKTNTMLQSAERMGELTEALSINYSPQLESFYMLNMDLVAQSTQSYIIITDTKGNIINFSTSARRYLTNRQLNIGSFGDVLDGKNVYKLGTYDRIFGQRIFTVAVPVKLDGTVHGIVFLNSPVPEMYREKNILFGMLAISIMVSSFIAFILSYIMSKKIIKPIKALSSAAHEVAKGDYEKRVQISNVDELAELGTAFNTMAESIEKHEKVRTEFIGNVSHDLRTPMTTISGFIEGILDGTIPSGQQEEYLKIVLSETKRLSKLVSTFLDITKYEEDKASLIKTSFDIVEMIRVVLLSFETIINDKNIQVSFEFESENIFVYADENEIHRVVFNLAENAVKFVNENGEIDVSVIEKGDKALISISNTGNPITQSEKQYIWDRFYKIDKSRTEMNSGFGLGLFIVKSIINQHDENIELDNYKDLTTFSFTLPTLK